MAATSTFQTRLDRDNPKPRGRRWWFVPYDQLCLRIGPWSRETPHEVGLVLVENPAKASRRPYHQQKLALVLASLRHFALEAVAAGIAVRHLVADGSYADALRPVAREVGGLRVMRPAERELRQELAPLQEEGLLEEVPHEGWLTTGEDFETAVGAEPPWRMDAFYRHVRRRTGWLMEGGKPVGGRFSFDVDNRKPWKGQPPAPQPPRFRPTAITREVGELVRRRFDDHPGQLDLGAIPASASQVRRAWRWALEECLPWFGPYEDAMSLQSRGLFHTRVAPLLNLGRLSPRQVVEDVLARDVELRCREGFLRQVLGWREFVHHVHECTDGFRRFGGTTNALDSHQPLPAVYWGDAPSGLHCLDTVVQEVWEEGYSHHITRLMVLGNLATLLDVSPRELCDWFWVAYTDAYDWVVEPNVLAMATFATGPLMTTKPYVSGAAYLDRMGDYCGACTFDPRKDCPITRLYWAFLARKQEVLAALPRMAMPMRSLARRSAHERARDHEVFQQIKARLAQGERVPPPAV